MAPMTRLFSGAVLCAALLLSFMRLSLEWSEQLVEKDCFGETISLEDEQQRAIHLTEQFEELSRRIAAKDRIAERLLAGELTLAQAAACFGSLFTQAHVRGEALRAYTGSSEGEILCRHAIDWVEDKVRVEQSLDAAEATRRRLESQLRQYLTEHGTVELPQ